MITLFPVSVAPMMGYTDRHARYLHRLLSPHSLLYTEMLTAQAVVHDESGRLFKHQSDAHPVVLQLGGSNPDIMADAAIKGEQAGFDQININVGCPSDRVQSGEFGACLMADPPLVADIFTAMQEAVSIPVTIKHRIGIDHQDSKEDLDRFVDILAETGCRTFVVHARKAWLQGLSPKQNRNVPPLDYERVYRLKLDNPGLEIVINGGIQTLDQVLQHLDHVDGVMIGREAFSQPWLLADIEKKLELDNSGCITHEEVQQKYAAYMQGELEKGTSVHTLVRPISGLFFGMQGARTWRRLLTENAQQPTHDHGALLDVVAGYKGTV